MGRTQALLHCLAEIFRTGEVARVPVYLNSPMATSVTELYQRFHEWHKLDAKGATRMSKGVRFVRSVTESKELNRRRDPMVVLSASGMITTRGTRSSCRVVRLRGPAEEPSLPGPPS